LLSTDDLGGGQPHAAKKAAGAMKDNIHPKYVDCTITCLCGNVISTRSTKEKLNVEICAACHPFFTGQQKIIDTAGRVERFRKRYADANYGQKK
jgi:large subunit ribosomal protein L31